MKIVGFQSGHDVNYCILENGIPIIHEEYERFLREKEPLGDGLKWFFDNNYKLDDLKYFVEGNPFNRNSGKYDLPAFGIENCKDWPTLCILVRPGMAAARLP